MRFLPKRWTKIDKRQCISIVLLGLFGVMIIGVPAPRSNSERHASAARFPCEASPCGCGSAEHCWDKCCCNTDEQKLTWAAEHGVVPPEFLVQRVTQAAKQKSVLAAVAKTSCCAARVERACCQTTIKSCCDKMLAVRKPKKPSIVLLWKAAGCNGMPDFWRLISASIVLPASIVSSWDDLFVERIAFYNERFASFSSAPEPPVD